MALVLGLYYCAKLTPALAVALGGALPIWRSPQASPFAAGLGRRLLKPLDLTGWSAAGVWRWMG